MLDLEEAMACRRHRAARPGPSAQPSPAQSASRRVAEDWSAGARQRMDSSLSGCRQGCEPSRRASAAQARGRAAGWCCGRARRRRSPSAHRTCRGNRPGPVRESHRSSHLAARGEIVQTDLGVGGARGALIASMRLYGAFRVRGRRQPDRPGPAGVNRRGPGAAAGRGASEISAGEPVAVSRDSRARRASS